MTIEETKTEREAVPTGIQLTALDPAFQEDPYPILAKLRELEPVHQDTTLNRWVLITPFHNMALMAPTTTEAQVDRHTAVFLEALVELYK